MMNMMQFAMPQRSDFTFNGLRVIESRNLREFVPVLALKSDVIVSEDFRNTFNKWLIDMFGQKRQFLMIEGKTIAMHPNNKQFLMKELEKL
jgi:hypothetical protein